MAINNIPLWQANDMFDMAGFNAKIGVENDNFSQLKMGGAITKNLPIAAGQTIAAGDVVDVVDGKVERDITFGQLAVGTVVQLNESGSPVDYLVVNQGKPSSMYDDSCDGTWLLRKNIFENLQWHSSDVNDLANSTLKAYLDSTFLARYDANIQAGIKQVKIPYRPGSGTSTTVNSGTNGLSCKVFLLGGHEIGLGGIGETYLPLDGAKLAYFDAGTGTTANNKRIAYLGGSATDWWLRSPRTYSETFTWRVTTGGSYSDHKCSVQNGVRPALVIDKNLSTITKLPSKSANPSQAIALQPGTAGQSIDVILSGVAELPGITAGTEITSPGVYGYCPIDGWVDVISEWAKNAGVQIATGSYVGNETYGPSNRNQLIFPFEPKFVFITRGAQAQCFGIIPGNSFITRANGNSFYDCVCNKIQNGVEWYTTSTIPDIQLNSKSYTYFYVAIGE